MAGKLITERTGVSGDVSFLVRIREAGVAVSKTFKTKKEAEKFIREVKSKLIVVSLLTSPKSRR